MEFAVGDRCASFDGDADRLMYFYKDGEQNLFWSFVWCTSSCTDDVMHTTVQAGPQRSEELAVLPLTQLLLSQALSDDEDCNWVLLCVQKVGESIIQTFCDRHKECGGTKLLTV